MRFIKRYLNLALLLLFFLHIDNAASYCQSKEVASSTGVRYPAVIVDGDTMPHIRLPAVTVYPRRVLSNNRSSREYIAMAKKVLKVYPYARLAVKVLKEINDTILIMDKTSAQKKYVKAYEKALLAEYKAELVKMRVSEGRVLIKLIDRETGETSYNLIETMRGKSSAFFWQALARLFGETLKVNYQPTGEDRMIEEIVVKIEHGVLEPMPLPLKKR